MHVSISVLQFETATIIKSNPPQVMVGTNIDMTLTETHHLHQ